LWWFFFGTVISELFQHEIRGREAMLSPQFCDYLKAARSSLPEPPMTPMTMTRFAAMCTERDRERAIILDAMSDTPLLLSPVCTAPAFRHGEGNWNPDKGYRSTMRH